MSGQSFLVVVPRAEPAWGNPDLTADQDVASISARAGLVDPFTPGATPAEAFLPLLDWSCDVERADTAADRAPDDAEPGPLDLRPLTVVRAVDALSPRLFAAAVDGTRLDAVDVVLRGPGRDGGATLYAWRFGGAVVKKVSWVPAEGAPAETVVFEYASVTLQVREVDKDGEPGEPAVAGWDRVQNAVPEHGAA